VRLNSSSPIAAPTSNAVADHVPDSPAATGSTSPTAASYARLLRPLLPPDAFRTDPSRLALVLINLAILVLGWSMAARLERWPGLWPLAFLPVALVMGNSVIVLLFATHDLLHGSSLRGHGWRRVVGLLGLALLWMPPTLWQAVHNREHHSHTNSLSDPDRSYLEVQPATWGKWIQHLFTPSDTVRPLWLLVGMGSAWVVHNVRTLGSVLLFKDGAATFTPAAFRVSAWERWQIGLELLAIVALHGAVVVGIGAEPLKLLLGYFLPLWIGYAGAMTYIYTNHMLCPLTESNDPLANTLSIRVPRILDVLHLNFSYHTEHHIFPGLNSSYYPLVRQLLQQHYPERYQLLEGAEAWRLLLGTPRHYRDATTLTTWRGERQVRVPLPLAAP
jgi:fatty acid desaturase